jgi:hypothetical protein
MTALAVALAQMRVKLFSGTTEWIDCRSGTAESVAVGCRQGVGLLRKLGYLGIFVEEAAFQ